MTEPNLDTIDPQIRGVVGAFLQEALDSFGSGMESLALTGSCVTGDYVHGRSDINSVLVLNEMAPALLDKLASMGRRYGKKRLRAPLVMTPEYIERSLDVFPIEFFDIKLIHATVHGPDRFSGLTINKSLLRLQCERDLKAKLIHLHQGYISCSGGGRGLRALLAEALPGFFPLFRAMLSLCQMSKEPAVLKDEVLTDTEAAFGLSLDCLREVRAMAAKRGFGCDWSGAKETFTKVYKATYDLSLTMDRISC
jgi:hypothetical protein